MAAESIEVTLTAKGVAQVVAAMKIARAGLDQLTAGSAAAFSKLSAATSSLGAIVAGIASSAALVKIATSFKALVDLGGSLSDRSAKTGISVSRLVVASQALADNGKGFEDLDGAIAKMQERLSEAASNKGIAANFERIGLSVQELISLSPDRQFDQITQALSKIEGPAARTAAAMSMFGKSGVDLLTFVGADGALGDAEDALGNLPEIIERNANALDTIGDVLGRIALKTQGFFAGVFDIAGKGIPEAFQKLNSIDLTGIGQRVGAFVELAKRSFDQGQFSQFLGLAIEAGFEIGLETVGSIVSRWINFFFSGELSRVMAAAIIGAVTGALNTVVAALGSAGVSAEALYKISDAINSGANALRDSLGVNASLIQSDDRRLTAAQRLRAEIEKLVAARNAEAQTMPATGGGATTVTASTIDADELAANRALLEIELRRHAIDADFRRTDAEKFALKREAMEDESRVLSEIITKLEREIDLAQTAEEADRLRAKADSFRVRRDRLDVDQNFPGPDPASFGDQMADQMNRLKNQFGTLAQQVARGFSDVIGSAVNGVASSVRGLLTLTMSWGDALRNIGTSILDGVINSISRMFAEWIVGRLAVKAVEIASSNAEKLAKLPSALMTAISSYGLAALAGVAALGAAIAWASGAFMSGGYTGDGARNEPAGIVHRGEFVLTADEVSALGIDRINSFRSGGLEGVAVAAPAPQVENRINIAAFSDRADARKFLKSREGERIFVDMTRKNRGRV